MTTPQPRDPYKDEGKRATAMMAASFAGVLLITVSTFQVLQGISAVANDDIYVAGFNYIYELDVSAWGWIHIVIGVVAFATAIGILKNMNWARVTGIVIACIGSLNSFLFLPHYPIWSLVVIAFNVFVIWALCFQISDDY